PKGWCHSFQLEKHKLRHKVSVSSLPMHPHKSCAIAATESSSEEARDTGSGDPGLPADGSGWLVRTFVAIFLSNGVDNVIWFVFMLLIPDLANVAKEKETTKLVAIKGSSATMDEVGCTDRLRDYYEVDPYL
uniref:Uncharacterized protein n=1 Tax=Oryza glaberrima TaxID=4538 RepID=I1NQ52_ORYGL